MELSTVDYCWLQYDYCYDLISWSAYITGQKPTSPKTEIWNNSTGKYHFTGPDSVFKNSLSHGSSSGEAFPIILAPSQEKFLLINVYVKHGLVAKEQGWYKSSQLKQTATPDSSQVSHVFFAKQKFIHAFFGPMSF